MVKKTFLFGIFYLLTLSCFSQLKSIVDERFELTSLVFRLANAEEYVNNGMTPYVEEVDTYFSKFVDHPLIPYIRKIREEHYIGYDAVASSTSLLLIEKNKVVLNPRIDINKYLKKEKRWKEEILIEYIQLVNDFYKKTKFNSFYTSQKGAYKKAEDALDEVLAYIDGSFFEEFYGRPFGIPSVYLSMLNGPSNYALLSYTDDPGEFGIVIGAGFSGPDGIPFFYPEGILHTIVHEFTHNFANPLVDVYFDEMLPAAEVMFPYVKERLAQYAYKQPLSILYEGFTNLFTHQYFLQKSGKPELDFISDSERRGFVWMGDAVAFMDNFHTNRDIYSTVADFMPHLVGFFKHAGSNMERIMIDYRAKTPRIVGIYPSLENVSLNTQSIRIQFSKPMRIDLHGLRQIEDENIFVPEADMPYWEEDGHTFVVPVKNLKRKTQYGFIMPWEFFASEYGGYSLLKDFEVRFTTEE